LWSFRNVALAGVCVNTPVVTTRGQLCLGWQEGQETPGFSSLLPWSRPPSLRREPANDLRTIRWELRDLSGSVIGVVQVPVANQVLAVDGDVVWTEELDPLGMLIVRRMRMRRMRRSG
jgi:hypothetical protein